MSDDCPNCSKMRERLSEVNDAAMKTFITERRMTSAHRALDSWGVPRLGKDDVGAPRALSLVQRMEVMRGEGEHWLSGGEPMDAADLFQRQRDEAREEVASLREEIARLRG